MSKIKSLKRKRVSIKSRLTSFSKFVETTQVVFDTERKLPELTVEELAQRLKRITQELLSEYLECAAELENLVKEEELDEIYADRDDFEESYYKIVSKAQLLINKTGKVEGDSRSVTGSEHGLRDGFRRDTGGNVKLPILKLPEFDGSFDKWLAFYDTFKSVIHSNDTIAAIQKFQYLSSALTGEAAKVIQGLEISSANYDQAWKLLGKRYQNKPLMIHNHIKGIVEYPKLTKQCFTSMRNLLNTIQGHLRALESLDEVTENWSSLLIYIIVDKFDSKSRGDWEKELVAEEEFSKVSTLIDFMEKQCQLLEKLDKQTKESNEQVSSRNSGKQQQSRKTSLSHALAKTSSCPACKEQHQLYYCKSFLNLPINSRIDEVKRYRRCLNCLREGHISINCTSTQRCRKCQKPHNTLLHIDKSSNTVQDKREVTEISQASDSSTQSTVIGHVGEESNTSHVLPTAVVQILDSSGKSHDCTALLDSGSQSNFLTTDLSRRLKLKTSKTSMNVLGVNQTESRIYEMANATINSKCSNLKANLSFYLTKQITSSLPSEPINLNKLHIPDNVTFADPQFYRPKNIDMLIGVDLFWELLCPDSSQHPYLHKTKLGHVVSGRIPNHKQTQKSTVCNLSSNFPDLSQQLKQFWEIEECPRQEIFSTEEKACESNYTLTTTRNSEGRFIVTIPFKGSLDSLGESEEQAKQRFLALERRLERNEKLKGAYSKFMEEYEQLGHMSMIQEEQSPAHTFYLPHHGVLKEDSITTKLRVVFDGSASSSTGVSINDLHMVGPTIQQDLLTIILRFRIHRFVVGADISMMYRQVLVHPEQRPLQRIIWRPTKTEPLRIYELNTITYGLASSAFLAIRCLFQLAEENEQVYPKIAQIIRKCMYVDDLLYGTDTIEEAIQIRKDISNILAAGGFQLRKWISNEPMILNQADTHGADLPCHIIQLGENEVMKTLGLSWSSTTDNLIYDVSSKIDLYSCTKRSILSLIARIYDPLGLLSPCIITAKIILQKLWLEKSSWDAPPPTEIADKWQKFIYSLSSIERFQVSRQVFCTSPKTIEIHAFSDASEAAYGAAVYIRSINLSGQVSVKLLCAKSKVAPLKSTTLPRLELCGAQVAVRLVDKVKASLDLSIDKICYWSDSSIVLSWLKLEPCTLKTFVSNRVSEIQSLSKQNDWQHVISQDNPADMLTRGVEPTVLQDSILWWEGPSWLSNLQIKPSSTDDVVTDLPEVKSKTRTHNVTQSSSQFIVFENYSNLNRLQRIVAFCLRFINNCKIGKEMRQTGHLTTKEIGDASIQLIKIAQRQTFHEEINFILKKRAIHHKSKILSLNPFIHTDGTLRVGGRLAYSNYDFHKRHPIILPPKHHLTKLIFLQEHKKLLHAGPQTLLSCLREVYWPISGRNLARKTVHDCVRCFRANPKQSNPIMGNLPPDRITPAPPFHVTGVDYAGPFLIKDRKGRGSKTTKCYVALFICFVTRAVHLELVSDLTTDCFILALRRFASYWGMPTKIHSDNGSNFVGANSELKELGKFFLENHDSLNDRFANERFNWVFTPAYSPHFGGIWEAGVKSTKYHLKRVMSNALLTFEEFYSILAQIGAILNSRPLSPISSHPDDLQPLTPAHLLVGRSLTSVPDPDVTHLPESHLSRYQRIQQIQQHFWARWSKEYVSELQCRTKWKTNQNNIQLGTLVLIKDDNAPPMKWHLGRVVELHPGQDSIVRVVSLKTSRGVVRRAVTRLCPLPVDISTSTTN